MAFAVFDIIWTASNKSTFEGTSTSFFSAKASIWAIVRDTSKFDIGSIQNNTEDWIVIQRLGVKGRYPKSTLIKEVIWNSFAKGWLKCNIDGSAHGSPSPAGRGGIFRTCRGFTKCCFSLGIGICCAFEAEMMALIIATEKAFEFN